MLTIYLRRAAFHSKPKSPDAVGYGGLKQRFANPAFGPGQALHNQFAWVEQTNPLQNRALVPLRVVGGCAVLQVPFGSVVRAEFRIRADIEIRLEPGNRGIAWPSRRSMPGVVPR